MPRILKYSSEKPHVFASLEMLLFVVVLTMSSQHRKNARVAKKRGVLRLISVKFMPVKIDVSSFGDRNDFSSLFQLTSRFPAEEERSRKIIQFEFNGLSNW